MNRLFITGDTHSHFERLEEFCPLAETTLDDVLVVLGDNGLNFYKTNTDTKRKVYVSQFPITIFCIRGNHDIRPENISGMKMIKAFGDFCYQEEYFPNIYYAIDGGIYDFNGKKALVIGGAYSIDKYYRFEIGRGDTWFEDEQLTDKEKEEILKKVTGQFFDYVFTHTCALHWQPTEVFISMIDQTMVDHSTEEWLSIIESRINYKLWIFGHFHTSRWINDKVRILYKDIIELKTN